MTAAGTSVKAAAKGIPAIQLTPGLSPVFHGLGNRIGGNVHRAAPTPMFRLDPKQAVIDHVAGESAAGRQPSGLSEMAAQLAAAQVEPSYSGKVIVGTAQAVEALLLAALGVLIHGLYVETSDAFYVAIILGVTLGANISFNVARTHRIPAYRSVVMQTGRVLAGWSLTFTIVAVGLFLFKASDMVSRVWLVSWYAGGA